MEKYEVVILANSVKHNKHCVAGKVVGSSQWVRVVSIVNGAALSDEQSKIRNVYGTFNVKPLQKAIIELERPAPLLNQPENYLISDKRWEQHYSINCHELTNYLDHPESLWGKNSSIQYEMIYHQDIKIDQSLYLVKITDLKLLNNNNKRRASFTYNGNNYEMPVTDPNFGSLLQQEKEPQGILCISLGEEYNGNCYKLVAAIF